VKVALTGPIDLRVLQPALDSRVSAPGYAFPMTAHLALQLLEMGHQVHVVTLDPSTEVPYRLSGTSLEVSVQPMRSRARDRALDAFRSERRLLVGSLRAASPDIVHAHWTYEFAIAAERSGLPTLVTVHDWAPAILAQYRDAYRALRLGMQIRAVIGARNLTAISPYIRDLVRARYRKPCLLIPNGLPDDYFDVARPGAHDVVRFGCLVTHDDPRKNLRTLLEAFALLRRGSEVPVVLSVAGGGCAPGDRLQTWAGDRGLEMDVEFRGPIPVSDVPSYLAGLDVFVHPAREESFGMTILEAMAVGTPVVGGRRSGAVPWLLEEGRSGVLTDVDSAPQLAAAMASLLDAQARAHGSVLARARSDSFRMRAVAGQYVDEYHRVLGLTPCQDSS
jgi:L-malate glycosyltransferase